MEIEAVTIQALMIFLSRECRSSILQQLKMEK